MQVANAKTGEALSNKSQPTSRTALEHIKRRRITGEALSKAIELVDEALPWNSRYRKRLLEQVTGHINNDISDFAIDGLKPTRRRSRTKFEDIVYVLESTQKALEVRTSDRRTLVAVARTIHQELDHYWRVTTCDLESLARLRARVPYAVGLVFGGYWDGVGQDVLLLVNADDVDPRDTYQIDSWEGISGDLYLSWAGLEPMYADCPAGVLTITRPSARWGLWRIRTAYDDEGIARAGMVR